MSLRDLEVCVCDHARHSHWDDDGRLSACSRCQCPAFQRVDMAWGVIDGVEALAVWPAALPGCIATGASRAEAFERLRDMLPRYHEALRRRGV